MFSKVARRSPTWWSADNCSIFSTVCFNGSAGQRGNAGDMGCHYRQNSAIVTFVNGASNFVYDAFVFINGVSVFVNGATNFVFSPFVFINGAFVFVNGAFNFVNGAPIFLNIFFKWCLLLC